MLCYVVHCYGLSCCVMLYNVISSCSRVRRVTYCCCSVMCDTLRYVKRGVLLHIVTSSCSRVNKDATWRASGRSGLVWPLVHD